MKSNKSKNTTPELMVKKYLWSKGYKGYRLNYKKIPGSPDICFVGRKIAVFIHGCFWHRCPLCSKTLPKSNTEFWKKKFELNVLRDERKIYELKEIGWKVYVLWECQIKKDIVDTLKPLIDAIEFDDI